MHKLIGYARGIFWLFGIVEIGFAILFAVTTLTANRHLPGKSVPVVLFISFIALIPGTIACLAARAWKQKKRFARPLVAIASAFHLFLFPLGTVAGAVGLGWCFSRKFREREPVAGPAEQVHEPKPGDGTHPWIQLALPVFSLVTWLGAWIFAGWWGRAHGLPSSGGGNGFVRLILCEWVAVFLHELGHAVAARAVGMRLAFFNVGPFSAQKQSGKWKLRFSLPGILLSTGGGMASTPLHVRNLRRRMAVEVAAGPIASVVTAAVSFAVLSWLPGSAWESWWRVPALIAAISAWGALINMMPFASAAAFSDGAALIQLLRGGPFADLREALKMVGATTVTATRPRDMDPRALADGLRAGAGRPEEAALQLIQLVCAVDREDWTAAREHLESGLQRIPDPDKAMDASSAAEVAFYLAYLDGNASRAADWLRRADELAAKRKTPLSGEFEYWLAVAAVREASGEPGQADDAYRQAEQLARRRPPHGLYEYERELLEAVRKANWVTS